MTGTRVALAVVFLTSFPLPYTLSGGSELREPNPAAPVLLRVAGEVPRELELTAEAISRLPRQTIRVKGPDGTESAFEGVRIVELLQAAGAKFGEDLRGPALATYLVVEAADGYRAVFALPELDPTYTDQVILLADRRDGKALDANDGPLRVVVPGEKKHSRWVRQVILLKVGRA
jgi:DMSO/TMAO reductase YedYZ molybdopterin-dependent catalytic subunit